MITMCFLILFGAVILSGVVVKLYIKLRIKRNECYTCLNGKTAIITGANTGIGYITALDFAMRGARVILACRNQEKAYGAQQKIIKATGNNKVIFKIVDMQSFDSVRAFAADINETEERIDILVNNAGASHLGNHRTADGNQITMQTNHLSPFLLTILLIRDQTTITNSSKDKLKSSEPSRIVNVSSSLAEHLSRFDVKHMNEYPRGREWWADTVLYANTKLCNILFTTELSKKLEFTGVTVNALNPGPIKTEIGRNLTGILKYILMVFQNLFYLSSQEGSQTSIYVSLSKDLGDVSGQFFDNCESVKLYRVANNATLARKVWEKSEELVRLEERERIHTF